MSLNQNRKPNFLIIGAAKAGTTSLYEYLIEHPEVYLCRDLKESFFLSGQNFENINEQSGLFHLRVIKNEQNYYDLFRNVTNEKAIGEICVGYLYFYETSILQIKKYLGDPKIIIILRNPIDRAYSNYMHFVRDNLESASFAKAIELEDTRAKKNYWWGFQYLKAGLYFESVKTFINNFSQVKVYLYDDLQKDGILFYQNILRFLDVSDDFIPKNIKDKYNVSGIAKNKFINDFLLYPHKYLTKFIWENIKKITPQYFRKRLQRKILYMNYKKDKLDLEFRMELLRYFKEDITKLSELLDKDLSHWK